MLPAWSFDLKSCARTASVKMVAMPKNAAIHIQKIAPGPPMVTAVAAPAMLPVPTCAATAVASDWNEDMPLFPALLPWKLAPERVNLTAAMNFRIWTKRRRSVK